VAAGPDCGQDDAVLATVKAWRGNGGACGASLSDGHP